MIKNPTKRAICEVVSPRSVENSRLDVLDFLVDARQGLLSIAMNAGLGVLRVMLENDRQRLCGPKGRPNPDREATRYGYDDGAVGLGGRRVAISKPRVRTIWGEEVPLPTYERFNEEDPLSRRVLEQMIVGVSTRNYSRSLETAETVEERIPRRSAVSRQFVARTQAQLEKFLARPLGRPGFSDIDVGRHGVRRPHPGGGPGHRRSGTQRGPRGCRGFHGERGCLPAVAGEPRGPGAAGGASPLVRHRRGEGPAEGDPRNLRGLGAGAALPVPQDPERGRASPERETGVGESSNAEGLRQRDLRPGAKPPARSGPAPRRSSRGGGLFAGRTRGNAHHPASREPRGARADPGHHEPHRESPRHPQANQSEREALAGWRHGAPLGGHGTAGSPQELPPGERLSGNFQPSLELWRQSLVRRPRAAMAPKKSRRMSSTITVADQRKTGHRLQPYCRTQFF